MLKFGSGKVWIDFLPYANRLFAAGRNDLWNNADTFISVFSQGQGLLRSDVLSIPVLPFYQARLDQDADLTQSWSGKRAAFALKKMLAWSEPQTIIRDILTGLQHLYQGAKPVVLLLPSPQKWLQWLHPMVRPGQELSLAEDDIEAASMYLAEFLRGLSSFGLSSVVMEEQDQPVFRIDQALSLYRPVLNLAKHYQWSTGVLLEEAFQVGSGMIKDFDFTLIKNSDMSALTTFWEKGCPIGGGLNRNFWSGQPVLTELAHTKLFYGEVPEDAEPETVLSQLKWLR